MSAPINAFEVVESIRFFGQVVATDGVSQKVKDKCNEYMERLLDAMEKNVDSITAANAGLSIVRGDSPFN